MTEQVLFWSASGVAVLSGIGMVLNVRNTVNAALCLVVAMLAIAVLFVMLSAEFIGVLQVMVYAGAIVVLFLFVIMLLNLRGGHMGAESQPIVKLLGAGLVLAATVKLAGLLAASARPWPAVGEDFGRVASIGEALYTDYLLAFEVAGVLLLAGIVGAIMLAKRDVD